MSELNLFVKVKGKEEKRMTVVVSLFPIQERRWMGGKFMSSGWVGGSHGIGCDMMDWDGMR